MSTINTTDLKNPYCPNCNAMLTIVDYDQGEFCGEKFSVSWKCRNCGATGTDTYSKTNRTYSISGMG